MVFEKLIVFRGENALWNLGDIKIGGGVHEFMSIQNAAIMHLLQT